MNALLQSFVAEKYQGPFTMLNLLAYEDKESSLRCIEAFGEGVGTRYWGVAKQIGEVFGTDESHGMKGGSTKKEMDKILDDIAQVQYPSLDHFVAMVMSKGYKYLDAKGNMAR